MKIIRKISREPNLFILGAAKAGTTTVYDILNQHPQITLSFDKEPMFFSDDYRYSRGINWYLEKYFPRKNIKQIMGEASPHYLFWSKKVAQRISLLNNSHLIKFIVILRNPSLRAYSWYWNMRTDGRETLSFKDALEREKNIDEEQWNHFESKGTMDSGFLRGGQYFQNIQNFLTYFKKEKFFFILFDDLVNNQQTVAEEIFNFLNVDSNVNLKITKKNTYSIPRSQGVQSIIRKPNWVKTKLMEYVPILLLYRIKQIILKVNLKPFAYPKMDDKTKEILSDYYNSEIIKLEKLIDRDLSMWR